VESLQRIMALRHWSDGGSIIKVNKEGVKDLVVNSSNEHYIVQSDVVMKNLDFF
jgi:hypothetical protein